MCDPSARDVRLRETLAKRRVMNLLKHSGSAGELFAPEAACDAKWLRRHAGQARVLEPLPGLFVELRMWNGISSHDREIMKIEGLNRIHSTWSFWGIDAAVIWGLQVPNPLLGDRYIVQTRVSCLRGSPVHLCRPETCGPIEVCNGVRVTDYWRTVADCLLRVPFSFGLALADSALRAQGVAAGELEEMLRERCARRHGLSSALAIAHYADARSENGGESRFRAFLIVYGFAAPELQVEFADPLDADGVFRVDYFWRLEDGSGVIGELDGMEKYLAADGDAGADVEVLARERQRESRLTLLGYKILRFHFNELSDPKALARKLELAGIPRDSARTEEWAKRWNGE